METKRRIDYIDLMRGICIILVVLHNTGALSVAEHSCALLATVVGGFMPLYFFISGLFFKRYGSFSAFFRRRFRMLVVPILVFAPLGGLMMQSLPWTEWSLANITRPAQWVAWLTTFTNIPLWFLRALFIGSLMMYGLHLLAERGARQAAAAAALSVAASAFVVWFSADIPHMSEGWQKLVVRCGVFNAMAMLPYLFAGGVAARLGLTSLRRNRATVCIAAAVLLVSAAGSAVLEVGDISWCYIYFRSSALSVVASPVLTILLVWSLSFIVVRLPYVSYMGRYSIIVLVTHYPLFHVVHGFGLARWPATLAVLAVMPVVIWLCARYLPWACAQPGKKISSLVA